MAKDNVALVLRHHEDVWTRGNLGAVDELFAEDFVGHHPGAPDWLGPEGVRKVVLATRKAFPDFSEFVEHVISENGYVVTRFTASGTHLGPYRNLAPTGKRFSMSEIGIFRIENGRIAEKWGQLDRIGMLQQLGIVPGAWPSMELLYHVEMDVEVLDIGATPAGRRQVVQIRGGTFDGPQMKGTVVPGGGDWLVEQLDGTRRLDVRVTLRTHDDELIYAHYLGIFNASPETVRRIRQGEADPSEYYFRVAPMYETAASKYESLNRTLAVGFGKRTPSKVMYSVYRVL
jgi:steroid delta-isomerase-like uncharacterized protein